MYIIYIFYIYEINLERQCKIYLVNNNKKLNFYKTVFSLAIDLNGQNKSIKIDYTRWFRFNNLNPEYEKIFQ